MVTTQEIPYRTTDHGSIEEEWLLHRQGSEWWYATGYLHDEDGRLYSWQYTLIRVNLLLVKPWVVMLAVTDFETGEHLYSQRSSLTDAPVTVDELNVRFGEASVAKRDTGIAINGTHPDFAFDLFLDYGKGAVWHCDDGVLQMGDPGPRQTTTYFSYSNMPTTGTLRVGEQTFWVTGKSWFDKQGGTFNLFSTRTHWEWFSLRFFDDEEMMLFAFPQSDYQDGTFIPREGWARRLNDYTLTALGEVTAGGAKFSSGWRLHTPGLKDAHYTITPLMRGQLNLAYFEQLASITTDDGRQVGLCFVELLPGVRNAHINPLGLLRQV